MRAILVLVAVFAAGMFIGHDFWPQSHSDPQWHFRYHRGKIPHAQPGATPTPTPGIQPHHGRILRPPGE